MFFNSYKQLLLWNQKRNILIGILCVILAIFNCLFWNFSWQEIQVNTCYADSFIACVQPSFIFMLLSPMILLLLDSYIEKLKSPTILLALHSRKSFTHMIVVLCISASFYAVILIAITILIVNTFFFSRMPPINWPEKTSLYWRMTGTILREELSVYHVAAFTLAAIFMHLMLLLFIFFILKLSFLSSLKGTAFAWITCLCIGWICSFPITPFFYRLQRTVCFSVQKIQAGEIASHFLCGSFFIIIEYLLLRKILKRKDFL